MKANFVRYSIGVDILGGELCVNHTFYSRDDTQKKLYLRNTRLKNKNLATSKRIVNNKNNIKKNRI